MHVMYVNILSFQLEGVIGAFYAQTLTSKQAMSMSSDQILLV